METHLYGIITTERHGDGWKAYLTGDRACWEYGSTQEAAIGKLMITRGDRIATLVCKARGH